MNIYRVSFTFGLLILVVGFALSLAYDDPYIFRRFGALTTGYAACLVILQIALENRFEASKELKSEMKPEPISPTRERWFKKRSEKKFEDYSKKRMTIAKIVAGLALLGEVTHGFGDFLIKLFL